MTRTPWWYSGDDEQNAETSPRAASAEQRESASSEQEGTSRSGTDWGALLSGAQRLVDWATETVMAPHSEHADPREHPDCVICKAIALLPDGTRATAPTRGPDEGEGMEAGSGDGGVNASSSIEWIPIRGDLPAL